MDFRIDTLATGESVPLSSGVYANLTLQLDTICVYLGFSSYFLDIS